MFAEVDARNLNCPQPVINTKKALDEIESGTVITIVNNEAALQNVLTLAKNMGCEVEVEQKGEDWHIQITKKGEALDCSVVTTKNEVVVFTSDVLGRGNDELGGVLAKAFFYTLVESEDIPQTIIFLNAGVKLTCEGSPVIEHLLALEKRGTEILSCGTCLDFLKLKEKLCVGQVTNMYTVWDKMNKADKVINF